jgi:hypothetical protein
MRATAATLSGCVRIAIGALGEPTRAALNEAKGPMPLPTSGRDEAGHAGRCCGTLAACWVLNEWRRKRKLR